MKNYHKLLRFDLSNCDTEPIHLIGRIQAHGFLLIMDSKSSIIRQVSANIEEIIEISVDKCVDKHLEKLFLGESYQKLVAAIEDKEATLFLTVNTKPYMCYLTYSEGTILLEFEPVMHTSQESYHNLNTFLIESIPGLNQQRSLQALSAFAADRIQKLLDYDRVMIYQYDQDWHGHVVGERVKEGVRSYYNHHFPASDIPQQARAMLVKKGIRQITNIHAESVEIIPYFHPSTGKPTDIIYSELRNPSEIHLEYLKNMDVEATLSIAVMVNSKLWGLVCCQHQSPKFIDYYQRNIAVLITSFYASALLSVKEAQNHELLAKFNRVEKRLLEGMEENLNIIEGLFLGSTTLLDLSEASGAALLLDNKVISIGSCPDEEQIKELADWAYSQEMPNVFCTQELSKLYPLAFPYKEVGSGLMLMEISRHNKEYLMYFKKEIKEVISWAGNPDKGLQVDASHKLHPRKSFEKWEQAIEGKSAPWSFLEEERASSLLKSVISIQLRCQAQKLKRVNAQLEAALGEVEFKNTQLEDFTRIASHNLLGPLNNIHALVNFYTTNKDFPTSQLALEKIDLVSTNMRHTLQDLHQVLEISTIQDLPKDRVDILWLIEKEKQNLIHHITEKEASIHTDLRVPTITYPKVYLESIIHNFLSNALKYSSGGRKPEVSIKTWEEKNRIGLAFEDNGIGIDLEKHGSKLFGLYKTFHANQDAKGLGLYLVKKQVEALGGEICVQSEVGKGTMFTLYFKKMV